MAEIINLRQARKRKRRADKEARAAGTRVRFGRTKADKRTAEVERDRQESELEGKKLED